MRGETRRLPCGRRHLGGNFVSRALPQAGISARVSAGTLIENRNYPECTGQIATADRKRRAFVPQSPAVIDQSRSKEHTIHILALGAPWQTAGCALTKYAALNTPKEREGERERPSSPKSDVSFAT